MLLIETYIADSYSDEIGLFASKNIGKGTRIWALDYSTTQVYWKREFLRICEDLSYSHLKELINHSYIRQGVVYTTRDNTRFINHSECPNVEFESNKSIITLRDIEAGEEIMENYYTSYDEDDFSFLNLALTYDTKDLLECLKSNLTFSFRPKSRFQL